MITENATVGQATLRAAIGFARNYKEIVSSTNEKGEPVRKPIYHNETNQYRATQTETMCRAGILVYLTLHFMDPDNEGIIRSVDVEEISQLVGCTVRTVENNLRLLQERGYISYCHSAIPYHYSVFLIGYKDIHKTVEEGGHGYALVNKEVLFGFLSEQTVNSLRLHIRHFLFCIEDKSMNNRIVNMSFNEMQKYLPKYVTVEQIKEYMNSASYQNVFIQASTRYSFSVILDETLSPNYIRKQLFEARRETLYDLEVQYNFTLTDKDEDDILGIGYRYPFEMILNAVRSIWKSHVSKNLPIRSWGAMVRSAVKADYDSNGFFAVAS